MVILKTKYTLLTIISKLTIFKQIVTWFLFFVWELWSKRRKKSPYILKEKLKICPQEGNRPICGYTISLVAHKFEVSDSIILVANHLNLRNKKKASNFIFFVSRFNFMHVDNTSINQVVLYCMFPCWSELAASWAGFLCCFLPTVFIWSIWYDIYKNGFSRFYVKIKSLPYNNYTNFSWKMWNTEEKKNSFWIYVNSWPSNY